MMWTLIPCTLIALIVGVSLGVVVGGILSADKIARLQRRVETWRARAEVAEAGQVLTCDERAAIARFVSEVEVDTWGFR